MARTLADLVGNMSVADARVDDDLIESASVPSLTAAVQAAKDKGLIDPIHGYTPTG